MFFIGQTRFSLFIPNSESWRLTKSHGIESSDSYRDELYNEQRLRIREEIFIRHSLPNLAIAAQGYDVTHVVSYSKSLPQKFKNSLAEAAKKYSFLLLDEREDGNLGRSLKSIAKEKASPGEVFGLYRLDDDDVLASNYFKRMSKFISPKFTNMVVSFPLGIESVLDSGYVFNLKYAHFPMNSMGLMSVCQMDEKGKITAPKSGAHNKADRDNAVILDSRDIGYFRFNHVDQDNAKRLSAGASLTALKKMMERYPDFQDLERLQVLFPTIPRILGVEKEVAILEKPEKVRFPLRLSLSDRISDTTVEVKHSFNTESGDREALVTLEIVDEAGNPVPSTLEFAGIGRSPRRRIGYYKYLNSGSGTGSTMFDISLPDGFFVKSLTLRRFGLKSKPFVVNSVSVRTPMSGAIQQW